VCEEAEEKGMKKEMKKGWDEGTREGGKGELNLVRHVREVLFLQKKRREKQQIEKTRNIPKYSPSRGTMVRRSKRVTLINKDLIGEQISNLANRLCSLDDQQLSPADS
jgi:hypothetical protein